MEGEFKKTTKYRIHNGGWKSDETAVFLTVASILGLWQFHV